nr:MAG TPA: hypothetical protein [Caudoviricetes sp.]
MRLSDKQIPHGKNKKQPVLLSSPRLGNSLRGVA